MKKILCFGDSNTFGFNPKDGSRYGINERWSGILKTLLKDKYDVIEAGCNNRTAFSVNPAGTVQTGFKVLPSVMPEDLFALILFIGINDLQFKYNNSADDFYTGIKLLIDIIRNKSHDTKIILAAPSIIGKIILKSRFSYQFDETSISKSLLLPGLYKKIAKEEQCILVDMNEIAKVSRIDGLHYDKEEHKKIAKCFYKLIRSL